MHVCVLSVVLAIVAGQTSAQSCSASSYPGPYNGPPMPTFPAQATYRMEINQKESGLTEDQHRFIDYTNNHASIHSWKNGIHTYNIYKYDTNEIATITWPADQNPIGATCQISKLSTSNIANKFGFTMVNGKPHVSMPLQEFGLNTSNPIKYIGKSKLLDGINCNVWEGCIDWPGAPSSKVTWYFSDIDGWYNAGGKQVVPVSIQVSGTTTDQSGLPQSYTTTYSFADYRPYLTKGETDSFKIPDGISCANDNTSFTLPVLPQHFSMRAEIVDKNQKYVNWIGEYYDTALNLTRYDYQANTQIQSSRRLSRIHDFNTGTAYILDPEVGNCTIAPIQKYGYDDKGIGANVRIRTPKEFFDLGSKYAYVGQRVERGINCDVWVTTRTDWPPPGPSYATTWEYYFSSGTVESVGDTTPFSVPVQLRITAANPPQNVEYNFYEFNSDRSTFQDFTIAQCFNSSTRADFLMVVPGNYRGLVWSNPVVFRRLVVLGVSAGASVSPIRVTQVLTSYNATGLLINFSILDKSPIQGDVANPIIQPTLDQAVSNLQAQLDANTFSILVQDPAIAGGFKNLVPSSYSVTRGTPLRPGRSVRSRSSRSKRDTSNVVKIHFQNKNDTGMTSGALAGLAIGLLIAGILVGLVVFVVIFKFREGGAGGAPTSFSNPNSG